MSNVILFATGTDDGNNYALKCSNDGILEVAATITTASEKPIETKTVLYSSDGTNTLNTYFDMVDSTYSLFTHDKENAINTSTLNSSIITLDSTVGTTNTDLATLNATLETTNTDVTALSGAMAAATTEMTALATKLETNNADLGQNSTSLGNNSAALGTNSTNLLTNSTALGTNSTNLLGNSSSLGTNSTVLTTNSTSLATNSTALTSNSTTLATNSSNLSTNSTNLASNTAALNTNNTNMGSNTTSLNNNTGALTSNNTNMSTNNTNLANNTTALTSNNTYLSSNNGYLNTNNQNLQSNTTAVAGTNVKLDTLNQKLNYLSFVGEELKVVNSATTSSITMYGSNYDTTTPANNPLYVDGNGYITANTNFPSHENIGFTNNITNMTVLETEQYFVASNGVYMGDPGFYYSNVSSTASSGSLLWYNNGPYNSTIFPTQTDVAVKDMDIFYVIMKNYTPMNQSYVYMNVYTKNQGSGDYGPNYRSKFHYMLDGNPFIGYGQSYMLYNGNIQRVKNTEVECPRIHYSFSTNGSQGPQDVNEIISHIEIQFSNPGGIGQTGVIVEGGIYVKNNGLLNYHFLYEDREMADANINTIRSTTDKLTFTNDSFLQTASTITDGTGLIAVEIVANSSTANLKNKNGLVTDSVLYAVNPTGDVNNVKMDATGNLNVNIAAGSISVSSVNIKDSSGNNITAKITGEYTGYLNTFDRDINNSFNATAFGIQTVPIVKLAGSSPASYVQTTGDSNGSLNVNVLSQAQNFTYLGGLNNVLNNVTIYTGGYNPTPAFDCSSYGVNSVLAYSDSNSTGAANFRIYLYAINLLPAQAGFGNSYCIGVLDPVWYLALNKRVATININLAPYKSLYIYSPEGQVNNVYVSLAY